MKKASKIVKVPAMDLVVNQTVNYREDYDIPIMMEEIVFLGMVVEPLHVRKEDNMVLKGNRRTRAVHQLLKDPKLPTDLYNAIEKLDVIYYEGLTERETTELMLDQGSQKSLSRVECVLACWRLQKQMYSEVDIITLLYHVLARFTGNTQKMYEAGNIPQGPARTEFLKNWLHGTVGNYILAAGRMGEFVREQFILAERARDRKLTDDEKKLIKFDPKRDRINKLASAKKKDEEGGGWNPTDGGVHFNAKIAEFIAEDNGSAPTPSRKPTPSEMKNTADSMKSTLSKAYLHCAGELPEGQRADIDALDTELFRLEELKKALRPIVDRVEVGATFSGGEVRELMSLFLTGSGEEFAKYIARFATK